MAEITIRISDKALRIIGVVLCVAVLVWAFSSLSSSGFFLPKYQLSVYVPEVSGLAVHAPVRLDGVDVGSVIAIRLARENASPERRIELVLRVEKTYQSRILSDSTATLVSEGLLGNRYVNISRGLDGTVIKPGAEIPFMPSEVLTLKDSLVLLGKTVDCINRATDSGDTKTQGGATKLACQPVSSPLAVGQRPNAKTLSEPTETTVCSVFDDPSGYNNTVVKVRGYVKVGFEHSLLVDQHCPEKVIWFAFGDGSGPPQVRAYVNGRGRAGGMDSEGRATPPLPITLVKDKSFVELTHYLKLSAKGAACADGTPTESDPDCKTYRVTATFSGRIDGVSKQLHLAHMKQSNFERPDGKGFGHMGMFDAQIVVGSVKNVGAVDETKLREATAKSQK